MSRIIDEAMRRAFPHKEFPKVSVLQLEYLVPKKWTNRIVETAGSDNDPFVKIEEILEDFLEDDVALLGFKIID